MNSYLILGIVVLIALATIGLVIKFIKKTIMRIVVIVVALAIYLSGGFAIDSLVNAGQGVINQASQVVSHATR